MRCFWGLVLIMCISNVRAQRGHGQPASRDLRQLKQLHVFFSDTDQTPETPYPKDPYNGASSWPNGLGHVTNVGKMRAYLVGKQLANHYRPFLGYYFHPSEVEARSSNVDKTIITLQTALAGMFSPEGSQVWNSGVLWQPVPVRTNDASCDWLASDTMCPKMKSAIDTILDLPHLKAYNEERRSLYAFIEENTGRPVKTFMDVAEIYNTLTDELNSGLILPDWTRNVFPQQMMPIVAQSYKMYGLTAEVRKLTLGPILEDIGNHFEQLHNGTSNKKVFVYGVSSNIIGGLLQTLGADLSVPPPYAATVILETHGIDGDYAVKLTYHNDTSRDPYPMWMARCPLPCTTELFCEAMQPFKTEDWAWECGLEGSGVAVKDVVIAVLSVICVMLLIVLIVMVVVRHRNHRRYIRPSES